MASGCRGKRSRGKNAAEREVFILDCLVYGFGIRGVDSQTATLARKRKRKRTRTRTRAQLQHS